MVASLALLAALALDIPPENPKKGCARTDATFVVLAAAGLLALPLLRTRKRQQPARVAGIVDPGEAA